MEPVISVRGTVTRGGVSMLVDENVTGNVIDVLSPLGGDFTRGAVAPASMQTR